MSWEIFRCRLDTPTDDCTDKLTTNCISEALYQGQADAMVSGGFAAAGYASIHMDDVRIVGGFTPRLIINNDCLLIISFFLHTPPHFYLSISAVLGGEEPSP